MISHFLVKGLVQTVAELPIDGNLCLNITAFLLPAALPVGDSSNHQITFFAQVLQETLLLANDIEFVNGSDLNKSKPMTGNRPRSRSRWVAVCLLVVLSGCASYKEGGSRTVGEFTDDVGIQAAVKTALVRDKEISGFSINVEVSRSVVTLYGRIPSDYARQKALQIAADVRGVASVQDRLTLVEE